MGYFQEISGEKEMVRVLRKGKILNRVFKDNALDVWKILLVNK